MKPLSFKKLLITCGGTGGHFFPGLSIAREFLAQGGEPLIVISGKNAVAQTEHVKKAGIRCTEISTAPFLIKNPLKLIRALYTQFCGYRKAIRLLRNEKPDAILAMGSFTGLPTILAARKLHIPIFLHDGNARIGRANRFFSRFAQCLMTAFPAVNDADCKCAVETLGMPIRHEILAAHQLSSNDAIEKLNQIYPESPLEKNRFTFVIFGGSQGAATLNQKLPKAIEKLQHHKDIQVIHLFGPKNKPSPLPYSLIPTLVLESSPHMEYILSAADWVVSRSGGSTLAELAFFGRAALLIPYPYASENHQTDNAAYFVTANAAILLPDQEASSNNIYDTLRPLMQDDTLRLDYQTAMHRCARPNAAQDVLKRIGEFFQ